MDGAAAKMEEVRHVRVFFVGLYSSALAVAAIVAYGFLFGLQSPGKQLHAVTWSDVSYFLVFALLGGALAATLLVRPSSSARFIFGKGAALGGLAGAVTGGLIAVWQILFALVVNVALERSGLYVIGAARPLNDTQQIVGGVLILPFTLLYSVVKYVVALAGGLLAGCIGALLYGARAGRRV